jgi:hypothetical protein
MERKLQSRLDAQLPGNRATFYIPPGHYGWVIGDQRYVAIDFTGMAKYAKPA